MEANWRVIATDNFARESVADILVIDHLPEDKARRVADILNEGAGNSSLYWHRAVPTSYRLSRGMEDLV